MGSTIRRSLELPTLEPLFVCASLLYLPRIHPIPHFVAPVHLISSSYRDFAIKSWPSFGYCCILNDPVYWTRKAAIDFGRLDTHFMFEVHKGFKKLTSINFKLYLFQVVVRKRKASEMEGEKEKDTSPSKSKNNGSPQM